MKKIFIFLLSISLVFACKTKEKSVASQNIELTKEMFFSMYRGGCYGTCPSYKITINADGNFTYFGKSNVDKLGAHKGSISNEETKNFFNKLAKYSWSSYPDKYPIDNVDFPQFTIEYFDGKLNKMIRANSNAADELKELSKEIDELIKSVEMIKLN